MSRNDIFVYILSILLDLLSRCFSIARVQAISWVFHAQDIDIAMVTYILHLLFSDREIFRVPMEIQHQLWRICFDEHTRNEMTIFISDLSCFMLGEFPRLFLGWRQLFCRRTFLESFSTLTHILFYIFETLVLGGLSSSWSLNEICLLTSREATAPITLHFFILKRFPFTLLFALFLRTSSLLLFLNRSWFP